MKTLAAFLVVAMATCAFGQQNDIPKEAPPTVEPEVFPIFPWDQIQPTTQAYREAKECGLNLVGFVHPENLDLVRQAGMKGFVSDPAIKIRGDAKDGSSGM